MTEFNTQSYKTHSEQDTQIEMDILDKKYDIIIRNLFFMRDYIKSYDVR